MPLHQPENPHTKSIDALAGSLSTDLENGLTTSEAERRQQVFGKNEWQDEKSTPLALLFLRQFLDPIIYVLLVAAILGFAFGENLEAIAVLAVIFITVLIGFTMEWQAIQSMRALKNMAETHAHVIRDGEESEIPSRELVPGDIIHLEAGFVVPADGRLVDHVNLGVKESALTGESEQVEKSLGEIEADTALGDRSNMVFNGTIITRGEARVLITATGGDTEMGKISKMTREAEDEVTPIEKRLSKLSKKLIWLTLVVAVIIAASGYIQGRDLRHMIETAIALAVAAIPEGLPIVAVIALARGMLRLAKDRVIIKKLRAVETLGSTGIICTDKTGTLTENTMAVRSIHLADDSIDCSDQPLEKCLEPFGENQALQRLVEVGVLCNNVKSDIDTDQAAGDPVEVALIDLARSSGMDIATYRAHHEELHELPFDTETKMMATLNPVNSGYRVSVKGAVESLVEHCSHIVRNNKREALDDPNEWLEEAEQMAGSGLRTLCFAYKETNDRPAASDMVNALTLLGVVGFMDPPREDVRPAMDICHKAGIRVVMITGDHPETARNIAQSVGLLEESAPTEAVVSSSELDGLRQDPKALEKRLGQAVVFARVNPAQKLRLVNFYQNNGYVVGMTGDGVNDAPALKKADIGIAMGKRGTEAAKEVADVILRDDQFTSIELAIRQGRVIFSNIRNFIIYLLSSNLAEILSVAVAFLSNLPIPLLPLQILYLNLVTDVFPALAMGMGRGDDKIMHEPPRPPEEPIMTRKMWSATILYACGITVATIGIVLFGAYYLSLDDAQINNLAFYTLVLSQLLNVFNIPEGGLSKIKNEVTTNAWVWAAIALCTLLTAMGYIIPALRTVLSLVDIQYDLLLWVVLFSLGSLLINQVMKKVLGY